MISLRKLSITKQIAISFLGVILVGSLLLNLPFAQIAQSQASYLDHLFISVSAVCVTGLFTQPIFSTYNLFGQIVILLMIQIGGLGLMTIISFFLLGAGRKMRFRSRMALSEALNKDGITNLKSFVFSIIKYTFIIELVGFILISFVLVPHFGLYQGLFNSLFLSISAFCNAGFDNWNSSSLLSFVHQPLLNIVVPALIILGGIGFAVWFDLTQNLFSGIKTISFNLRIYIRKLKVHTKLAICVSVIVIVLGTFIGLLLEFNNPNTIGNFSFFDKLMTSYFQTVTMRTAGFASIDYTLTRPVSNLIYMVTMFIGGSPGGTAGGIKTTTVAIVILMIVAEFKNKQQVNVFKHSVSWDILRKASIVFVLFLSAFLIGSILILIFDPQVSVLAAFFEVTSAINTVGVSMNLTPTLSRLSQLVLMILMFGGRIGPMTLLLSLTKNPHKTIENKYAEAKILIG